LDRFGAVAREHERPMLAREHGRDHLLVHDVVFGNEDVHVGQRNGGLLDRGGGSDGRSQLQRQLEAKKASFADGALRPQAATHQVYQSLADGESQAGSTEAASVGAIGLGEGIEDEVQFVGGNSDAGIFHGKEQEAGAG
jgi:hypothetical protein